MNLIVQLVVFPRSDTMSFVTLLPLSYRRFATVLRSVEPHLPPLTGETFSLASAIVEDGANWMLLRMDFEEVAIRRSSLILRCLILMLHLIEVPVCLHYIVDWKRRSGRSMSSEFVMWRWDVLPLWYFQLLGIYV